MNYFATFFTHSGAIKFSSFLTKVKIVNESCPVPRKLSSNCGIGVSFSYTGDIDELYIDDIEKIYFIDNDKYCLYKDFDN
ncbi:DUF3343 domain-containing protein [Paraclostridium sordellii]|uniref:DUF3343 domain-containing protein n=1 Tax=Paraclostridium sordellii TaxID=1505 RepID=UPI0005E3BDE4|nr:DUF3343 domain-containing protein [Paeniclostridium sordellii]CEO23745.1 Protein of uncharacterised function (DUF3343) [[Clostridium] sordellii] [Paeniclostridium sordellii]